MELMIDFLALIFIRYTETLTFPISLGAVTSDAVDHITHYSFHSGGMAQCIKVYQY